MMVQSPPVCNVCCKVQLELGTEYVSAKPSTHDEHTYLAINQLTNAEYIGNGVKKAFGNSRPRNVGPRKLRDSLMLLFNLRLEPPLSLADAFLTIGYRGCRKIRFFPAVQNTLIGSVSGGFVKKQYVQLRAKQTVP